jgi:type IV pilus assembly protein PilV
MTMRAHRSREAGYLLIEVLITMFILAIGLLGVVGLQARAQQAETDSYQRTQGLVLLRDIASRINANHGQAFNTTGSPYLVPTTAPLGTASTIDCTAPTTTPDIDLCAWDAALKGVAETSGGSNVGTMIGARGCITSPAAHTYLVEVVWQGAHPQCRAAIDRRVRRQQLWRGRATARRDDDCPDRRHQRAMTEHSMPAFRHSSIARPQSTVRSSGFTLVELMVAMAIASVLLVALAAMFVNTSAARGEMDKASRQIETGRYAMQISPTRWRMPATSARSPIRRRCLSR